MCSSNVQKGPIRFKILALSWTCPVSETLQYLKKHGQRLDFEVAKEMGVPLSTVRERIVALIDAGQAIVCTVTRFDNGKRIDAWQCRVAGFVPPAAPGRKAKPKTVAR